MNKQGWSKEEKGPALFALYMQDGSASFVVGRAGVGCGLLCTGLLFVRLLVFSLIRRDLCWYVRTDLFTCLALWCRAGRHASPA